MEFKPKPIELEFPMPETDSKHVQAFQTDDGLNILRSLDDTEAYGELLHVSVSRKHRAPTLEDIYNVRDYFFKRVHVLTPWANYGERWQQTVDQHPFCVHLWQMPEEFEKWWD